MRPDTQTDHLERIFRVVDQLRREPERTLSLGEIAEIAALSPFHVIRVFKSITRYTPASYQTANRIQQAKRLLVAERSSVTDACFAVGFSSLGSFSQRFATLAGVNPSDYRASLGRLDDLAERLTRLDRRPLDDLDAQGTVSGRLIGECPLDAFYFVGLFPPGPPQGYPIAGDTLTGPGEFVIRHVPDGTYVIYSAVVAHPSRTVDWVMPDSEVMTGGGQLVRIVGGNPVRDLEIELIPRHSIITPITTTLMALPGLDEAAGASHKLPVTSWAS
jgi:AraC-like DNA-binding protein